MLNRLTRDRKTISGHDLKSFGSLMTVQQLYQVRFPHDPGIDPSRKIKEIARYHLISLHLNFSDSILDVGSGSFYGAAMLARKVRRVVGIEKSRLATLQAKIAWRQVKNLTCLSGINLNKVGGQFDSATIINVIEHMPEATALNLLQEIASKLVTGGRLFLATPRNRSNFTGQLENPDHVQEYHEAELASLVGRAGYHIETKYIQTMQEIWPGRENDVDPKERAWFLWILKKAA